MICNFLTRVATAAVGDAPATATEFDYDLMGRVTKHRQYIGTQEYAMEYGYNLAGQMTSQKFPSGRAVTNSFDANGRLAGIADGSRTYLSGLQYGQHGGALSAMTLGNGIQETFGYNDRLQLTQMAWTKNNNVIQRYDYSFGQINPNNNTVDTSKNNGQLAQVESYIGGTASNPTKQFTQKFTNDSLGRLEKENEYRGDNGNQVYQQKFSYDRFGNRYLKAAENPPNQNPLLPTPIEESDISKATNRFTTDTIYDDAGNVIADDKFRGMDFVYDANGRMAKAMKADFPDALSVFDAGGNKIATLVNDVWTFRIYDAFGKMIAEYGGLQSVDEGGVKFVHQDIQGSTRNVTDINGNVLGRMDYQAFGEQIGSGIGMRTGAQGFSKPGNLRQRYALTERDEATGLDDTWFRKLENRAGRWTSPDPYNGSMLLGDPQSFNRYSYVENDPVNWVDPSGLNMAEVTCYMDGMQVSCGTALRMVESGGGYIDWHSVPGLSVITRLEGVVHGRIGPDGRPTEGSWIEWRSISQTVYGWPSSPTTSGGVELPGGGGGGKEQRKIDNQLNNCQINAMGNWARTTNRAKEDRSTAIKRHAAMGALGGFLAGGGFGALIGAGGVALVSASYSHEDYQLAISRANEDLVNATIGCLGASAGASKSAKNKAINETNTNVGRQAIPYVR